MIYVICRILCVVTQNDLGLDPRSIFGMSHPLTDFTKNVFNLDYQLFWAQIIDASA
jgi:hypothetical protein